MYRCPLLVSICLIAVLMIGGLSLLSAQAATPTLRELADQSGLLVGASVNSWDLGNPAYEATLTTGFNTVVLENDLKFCIVSPSEGVYDFSGADRVIAFAEAHDMTVRGHTLLWHGCFPEWLTTQDLSRDEAINLMRDHIHMVVGRYRGRIAIWDVVNEAFESDGSRRTESRWQEWIGDDYIRLAFEFAHEADPDALLYYNDYDAEIINARSSAIYEMVMRYRLAGVPIDGVGLQLHVTAGEVGAGALLDTQSLLNNIRRLGQLGLQVQFTEVDVYHPNAPTDEVLESVAGTYYQLAQTCLATPFCTAFITWGVNDSHSWLRNPDFSPNSLVAPLLFDDSYQPKLACDAVRDVLARSLDLPPILTDEQIAHLINASTITVEIGAAERSDPDQLAPDSSHGGLYYAAFPVTITLDGDDSDWVNIPRDTVFEGPSLPEDSETELEFAAAADAEYFYFLANVTDTTITYGAFEPASSWYQEDGVEFYLNTTGDLQLTDYRPGVAQIAIPVANIDNGGETIVAGGRAADAHPEAIVVLTDTGYRIEARVPLITDVWSITPEQGLTLGFQVHLNGASTSDGRDTKLIWSAFDTSDQSWTNPSVFGQLMFWNIEN